MPRHARRQTSTVGRDVSLIGKPNGASNGAALHRRLFLLQQLIVHRLHNTEKAGSRCCCLALPHKRLQAPHVDRNAFRTIEPQFHSSTVAGVKMRTAARRRQRRRARPRCVCRCTLATCPCCPICFVFLAESPNQPMRRLHLNRPPPPATWPRRRKNLRLNTICIRPRACAVNVNSAGGARLVLGSLGEQFRAAGTQHCNDEHALSLLARPDALQCERKKGANGAAIRRKRACRYEARSRMTLARCAAACLRGGGLERTGGRDYPN